MIGIIILIKVFFLFIILFRPPPATAKDITAEKDRMNPELNSIYGLNIINITAVIQAAEIRSYLL